MQRPTYRNTQVDLAVLDLLRYHTDDLHRLNNHEILALLQSEYGIEIDRKSLRRHLLALTEAGVPIESQDFERHDGVIIRKGWYYLHTFTNSELRLLMDGVRATRSLGKKQKRALCKKLSTLTSRYFDNFDKNLTALDEGLDRRTYNAVFLAIEIIDEAIRKHCQVSFYYQKYDAALNLQNSRRPDGSVRRFVVNPYHMAMADGRYYLIGNYDRYDNVAHFRLDRMHNIALLETPVKPITEVEGLEDGLNLPQHLAEHVYMFSGPSVEAVFRTTVEHLTEVVDWFGTGIEVKKVGEEQVLVTVRVNAEAMYYWLLGHIDSIELLRPQTLRERIHASLQEASAIYTERSSHK